MPYFNAKINNLKNRIFQLHARLDALPQPKPPAQKIQLPTITGSYVFFIGSLNGEITSPPCQYGQFLHQPMPPEVAASFLTAEPFFTAGKAAIETQKIQTINLLFVWSKELQYNRLIQYLPSSIPNAVECYIFEVPQKIAS